MATRKVPVLPRLGTPNNHTDLMETVERNDREFERLLSVLDPFFVPTSAVGRLTRAEQLIMIRGLAADGGTDREIAAITGLSLELVRRALSPDLTDANAARM